MVFPKWLIIAQNEYNVLTGRIRSIRKFLPLLGVGLLGIYIFLIAPIIVDFYLDDFEEILASVVALAIIEIVLFMIFFALLGVSIGSFLNVCIDRLPAGKSLINPPSYCDACDRRLSVKDLIPLFSFLWLRRRCRYCRRCSL